MQEKTTGTELQDPQRRKRSRSYTNNQLWRLMNLNRDEYDTLLGMIRLGTYDYVAAQSMGIKPSTWRRWLARGRRDPDPNSPYHQLYVDVMKARAYTRATAEIEVRKNDPKFWLRYGPAKEGWTETRVEYHGELPEDHLPGEPLHGLSPPPDVENEKLLREVARCIVQAGLLESFAHPELPDTDKKALEAPKQVLDVPSQDTSQTSDTQQTVPQTQETTEP